MASGVVVVDELPQDVRAYLERALTLPRIDATVGAWTVELVAVDGRLERVLRRESIGAAEFARFGIDWTISAGIPLTD